MSGDEQITDMLAQVQRPEAQHRLVRNWWECPACRGINARKQRTELDRLRAENACLSIEVRGLAAENSRLLAERDTTERFISHIEALCEHGCREEAAYCPEGTGLLEAWGRARMASEKPA